MELLELVELHGGLELVKLVELVELLELVELHGVLELVELMS